MTQALMVMLGMYLIFLSLWILAVVRTAVEDVTNDN